MFRFRKGWFYVKNLFAVLVMFTLAITMGCGKKDTPTGGGSPTGGSQTGPGGGTGPK